MIGIYILFDGGTLMSHLHSYLHMYTVLWDAKTIEIDGQDSHAGIIVVQIS